MFCSNPSIRTVRETMTSSTCDGVHCVLEPIETTYTPDEPTSCGLDFWHSAAGLRWAGAFMHGRACRLELSTGADEASLVCLVRRLPGGLHLASAFPYGHVRGNPQLLWQTRATVSKTLRNARVLRLEIPFTGPYLGQIDKIPANAGVRTPHGLGAVRHVLDLHGVSNDEQLIGGFHRNIRWAVRKAGRNGCQVRIGDPTDVATAQALYARTMYAKSAPVNYGSERWQWLVDAPNASGSGRLYIGTIDGRPSGMAAVVDGAASSHLIQLAVPPEAHRSRLGELLIMTAIKDTRAKALRYFDFMASPTSDSGLIAFKAKWNTKQEPIRHAVVPGMAVLDRVIDVGRWANRTGARLRGG